MSRLNLGIPTGMWTVGGGFGILMIFANDVRSPNVYAMGAALTCGFGALALSTGRRLAHAEDMLTVDSLGFHAYAAAPVS